MKPMVAAYLLAGVVVAALLWARVPGRLRDRDRPTVWHVLGWPFFVAVLVASLQAAPTPFRRERERIEEVERRLLKAAQALARQLGQPLGLERARIRALAAAMQASANRSEALRRALLQPGFDEAALALERALLLPASSPLLPALDARLESVRGVHALWRQARADLELSLARAAELEARLTLLRFEAAGPAVAAAQRAREAAQAVDELAGLLEELGRA